MTMPHKRKESPYEKLMRRCQQAQAETIQVAEDLVQALKAQPVWGTGNWFGLVERWESAEKVNAALKLCLTIVDDGSDGTKLLEVPNIAKRCRA